MATLTGNDGAILVNSVSVANVRSFSVEMSSDTIETTIMGNDNRTYVKGLGSFSGSCDIYFDPTEFASSDVTFNPTSSSAEVGDSAVAVKFYIDNDVTNDIGFTGSVIVTGYTVNSSMDGMVEASLSFQGTGGTSFSTSGDL
jgi:predicted secreted protein